MKKRQKIVAYLLAAAMMAPIGTSVYAATSVTTDELSGTDRYKTAVEVSKDGWSSATDVVLVNGSSIPDALSATPYAKSKNAPILLTEKDSLNADTKTQLTKLRTTRVHIIGGKNTVSDNVVKQLQDMGITVERTYGNDRYETSLNVAKKMDASKDITKIAVVNGDTGLPDAISVGAPAAMNGMPIILAQKSSIPSETKKWIDEEKLTKSYVVGGPNTITDAVKNQLPNNERLSGTTRNKTNAAVIEEFYTSKNLQNVYVATDGSKKQDELIDALGVGALAAKKGQPVLLVASSLDSDQKSLLEKKEFNKVTQVGGKVSSSVINEVKKTQEPVVEYANVTGVKVVDYKTLEITGTNLDKLTKSSFSLSGNTVLSYEGSDTKATLKFDKAFSDGTSTLKVEKGDGTTTSHNFTYSSAISSVQGATTKVNVNGVQYLEVAINGGQKVTTSYLKENGWTVEFKANKTVFDKNGVASNTSDTGKLVTELNGTVLGAQNDFNYEIKLTKGTTEIKTTSPVYVTVVDKTLNLSAITSFSVEVGSGANDTGAITSNKMVTGETATITNVKGTNLFGITNVGVNGFTVESSAPGVITVNENNTLTANATGTATITVKKGDVRRSINMTVVDQPRYANNITFSKSSVNILDKENSNTTIINAVVKDQYGDYINTSNAGLTVENATVSVISGQTTTKEDLASATLSKVSQDKKGNYTLTITELADGTTVKSGTGNLVIKRGTNQVSTISVKVDVKTNTTVNSRNLELKNGLDFVLDKYAILGDNSITLNYNQYNNQSCFIASEMIQLPNSATNDQYYVKSSNTDVITVTPTDGGSASSDITVTAVGAGSAYVEVYKKGTTNKITSQLITVNDSTPKISDVVINDIPKIVKATNFDVRDLFSITGSGNNELVHGVSVLNSSKEVRVDTSDDDNVIFYIENGSVAGYGSGDDLLATIEVKTDITGVSVAAGGTVNLEAGKKGNIIVNMYHGAKESNENPFKVKVIAVDIPAS
ncbi:cell wall-binding repeat-containing protein [Romboutsia sp. 1001285H_161024_C4]|uniref:cell wall-binding repeat-containing protein n=1 Tax=Romboutsia sp. 1001285H_161024_C4 TaxID=2787109 RepID=UPI00189A2BF3|nr:cell wall-binding repeat-containing protein [Romboutsia sp. 1001285H_161024_C4]